MSFIAELKRRNVVRVAVVYSVFSWLILQLTDVFGDLLELPAGTGKLIVLLLAIGLPVALVMSWVYEITPEGLARTSDVDRDRSIVPQTGRRLDRMIMAGLVLAIGVLTDAARGQLRRRATPVRKGGLAGRSLYHRRQSVADAVRER
jgi:hypothetical protein